MRTKIAAMISPGLAIFATCPNAAFAKVSALPATAPASEVARAGMVGAGIHHGVLLFALWTLLSLLMLAAATLSVLRIARLETEPRKRGRVEMNWPNIAVRYLLAIVLVIIAVVMKLWLTEVVGPLPAFVTLFPAVLLAASVGGGGPGIVATVLSAMAADYWILLPQGFGVEASNDIFALGIFTGSNLFLSVLAERLRRTRWLEAVSTAYEQELALLDMGNLLSLDPEHRITHWSAGCRRLYGFSAEETLGRFTSDVLQTQFAQTKEEIHRALDEFGFWEGELKRRRKDGSEIIIAALWALRRDEAGNPLDILEVDSDITSRKIAEESLRNARDELELRVQQRTAELTVANLELEQARAAAQAANRAKSAFLMHMSHEMRTPLNAVIGMTELVLRDPLSTEQQEYLTIVKDSGETLLTMIDDILDLSRVEAGTLALVPEVFDLPVRLNDTMKPFAIKAQNQGLQFSWQIAPGVPRIVVGDRRRLRQVVTNLVSNALKFTEKGSVAMEVSAESREGANVVLHYAVRDTGIGIPKDRQEAIFEKFEQADNSLTRRHGGAGMGLSIASQLVKLMGGRIWVESEVGRGSCFHFTVRLGVAPESSGAMGKKGKADGES